MSPCSPRTLPDPPVRRVTPTPSSPCANPRRAAHSVRIWWYIPSMRRDSSPDLAVSVWGDGRSRHMAYMACFPVPCLPPTPRCGSNTGIRSLHPSSWCSVRVKQPLIKNTHTHTQQLQTDAAGRWASGSAPTTYRDPKCPTTLAKSAGVKEGEHYSPRWRDTVPPPELTSTLFGSLKDLKEQAVEEDDGFALGFYKLLDILSVAVVQALPLLARAAPDAPILKDPVFTTVAMQQVRFANPCSRARIRTHAHTHTHTHTHTHAHTPKTVVHSSAGVRRWHCSCHCHPHHTWCEQPRPVRRAAVDRTGATPAGNDRHHVGKQ